MQDFSDALGDFMKNVKDGYIKANEADELDATPFEDTDGEKKKRNDQEEKLTTQKSAPKDAAALTKVPNDNAVIMKDSHDLGEHSAPKQ